MKEIISFNKDWRFHLGDIEIKDSQEKLASFVEAKTERKRCGPAARGYMDGTEYYNDSGMITHETWLPVDVPHDYIIGQEPKPENNNTLGSFEYENAWYRKHFELPAEDDGRRISLYFEGVAIHCQVYVNGCYMQANNCGYNSFEVDITDTVIFGGHNVVAIHVDATSTHEGWWYEGAGIYRPVWLIKSEPVAVDLYGVFVHPAKGENNVWLLPVDTTLRNDDYDPKIASVRSVIRDKDGKEILRLEDSISVPDRKKATLYQKGEVKNPALWDIETPLNLYTVETTVTVDGEIVEKQENRFGFRTFGFDPNTGFWLNERHVKIKGVCCHQDYGLTGRAVPKRVQRYRLELLKEMGANGYRCAHYPHHDYTMDQLDELGFLTMAETRHFESTPDGMAELEMLIKRDRNHPSVIIWSAGNEEPFHLEARGSRIAKAMIHRIKELDPTRPVTTAVNRYPADAKVINVVDVMGINYCMDEIDGVHEKFPDVPILASEYGATSTTRGWYYADSAGGLCNGRGYVYGYDRDTTDRYWARAKTWKFFMERPWIAGGYQWAGIEHRGETVWPRLCSQAGAIDLYLNKKDAFYQNQSHWLDKPMVHLLPHWNWQGMEGEEIRVSCYTNCDCVELYLNGELIGKQDVEKWSHAEWQVKYVPGCLEAKGYKEGKLVAEDKQETTGAPVKLRLTLNSDGVVADGEDVAIMTCDCLDAEGRHVPTASPFVRFYVQGDTGLNASLRYINGIAQTCNGQILGTGSDVCDHVPVTCHDRKMRAGLISVIARAGVQKGTMYVVAEADGLEKAVLKVELH
ncbi:MAG: glycoside hydrolase family 2 TIM barrel-domain containing protein [Clostridiales bacterium]|nr:glycoside hydrolase family 2 TIM barrel-domain containing protein [Clostridiales bacterium]